MRCLQARQRCQAEQRGIKKRLGGRSRTPGQLSTTAAPLGALAPECETCRLEISRGSARFVKMHLNRKPGPTSEIVVLGCLVPGHVAAAPLPKGHWTWAEHKTAAVGVLPVPLTPHTLGLTVSHAPPM